LSGHVKERTPRLTRSRAKKKQNKPADKPVHTGYPKRSSTQVSQKGKGGGEERKARKTFDEKEQNGHGKKGIAYSYITEQQGNQADRRRGQRYPHQNQADEGTGWWRRDFKRRSLGKGARRQSSKQQLA